MNKVALNSELRYSNGCNKRHTRFGFIAAVGWYSIWQSTDVLSQPAVREGQQKDEAFENEWLVALRVRGLGGGGIWVRSIYVNTALLVGRSRDRFPVVSLGILSVATDRTMCSDVDSASKNEYQGFILG